ncbi:response regulator, partial [Vibrio diabolicus]|uniref:response regulator n=1 Tax=Vibrio diabolicus TaxID=50719 RepID=UPI00211B4802|nr:HD domain-containing protein [Vibrio diabolicus]
QLKANAATAAIPVIFVTALRDTIDEEKGFEIGGVDYIVKPIVPAIVRARVKTHLSLVKIETLRETQIDLIQRLGRAAEYKDNETGMHVQRMSHYAKTLAMAAGMDEEQADELRMASTMHDIGKIAIPDQILLKPGNLDHDEFDH